MGSYIRQPIVSVLGHVDHGKSSLLDEIRGTSVVAREAGGITQHIGATEVPMDAILAICGDLADLAVLVVDVNEGFRPQTIESINILKRYKTPFLVAANKIDMVPGWRKQEKVPFATAYADQNEALRDELDRRVYDLVGKFFEHGFTAERYDKIQDFATTVAIVPTSAKHGVGIPELLLMLIGLAQRFLEADLQVPEGAAEGTILEVKEVLRPKPLDEIRDPQDRFDSVDRVTAAAGVKIAASGLEGATAGGPLREAKPRHLKGVLEAVAAETVPKVETSDEGILVKADALGSLEAIAYECKESDTPIKFARIGPVSRR